MTIYYGLTGKRLQEILEESRLDYCINHSICINGVNIVAEDMEFSDNKIEFTTNIEIQSMYYEFEYDETQETIAYINFDDEDKFNLQIDWNNIKIDKV